MFKTGYQQRSLIFQIFSNLTIIHHGTPTITGTRGSVYIILGSLAGGMGKGEVMQEYELTKVQVEAALKF